MVNRAEIDYSQTSSRKNCRNNTFKHCSYRTHLNDCLIKVHYFWQKWHLIPQIVSLSSITMMMKMAMMASPTNLPWRLTGGTLWMLPSPTPDIPHMRARHNMQCQTITGTTAWYRFWYSTQTSIIQISTTCNQKGRKMIFFRILIALTPSSEAWLVQNRHFKSILLFPPLNNNILCPYTMENKSFTWLKNIVFL